MSESHDPRHREQSPLARSLGDLVPAGAISICEEAAAADQRRERHVMVKGRSSPDDPSLQAYWKARERAKAKELAPSRRRLAENQDGMCTICGESLFNSEEIQKDHIMPRDQGGTDSDDNAHLAHLCCHQQKTALDRSQPGLFRKWLREKASLSRVQGNL
jgi:5-methylcytosine-specific restriction endonuclease McrA